MKRFLSIALLLLFVGSQINLAYGIHFCAGIPVESKFMISEQHLDCGMNMDTECKNNGSTAYKAEKCCADEYISISTAENFRSEALSSIEYPTFSVASFFSTVIQYTFPVIFESVDSRYLPNGPPLPKVRLSILLQVFRI